MRCITFEFFCRSRREGFGMVLGWCTELVYSMGCCYVVALENINRNDIGKRTNLNIFLIFIEDSFTINS